MTIVNTEYCGAVMVMVVLSFHMNSVIHILADAQLHRQWNVYYDTVNCMEYKFPIRIVA